MAWLSAQWARLRECPAGGKLWLDKRRAQLQRYKESAARWLGDRWQRLRNLLTNIGKRLGRQWAELKQDVWDSPTVRPVAGSVLSALVLLIVWLTITYAPAAPRGGGEIPEAWGRVTVIIITALTIGVGIEPIFMRMAARWWRGTGLDYFRNLATPLRVFLDSLGALAFAIPKVASVAWSFIDFVLARPGAFLAGATWHGWGRRYTHFTALMVVVFGLVIFSPPNIGLPAVVAGLFVIVAMVRRWTWVEADRETFLVERGQRDEAEAASARRKPTARQFRDEAFLSGACIAVLACAFWGLRPWLPMPIAAYALAPLAITFLAVFGFALRGTWFDPGPSIQRIGFEEDLRDEAMLALAWVFFLIPLGLDAVQQSTCPDCAFRLAGRAAMPSALLDRLWLWLGYFGAELAKTVPFVDWSEVFHVANGSPIETRTTLGAQVAFALRAGLDLLFLAAIVQAVGVAGRLREQSAAFRDNRLPILEPFSEAQELSRAGAAIEAALEICAVDQAAIKAFPRYEDTRLEELIRSGDGRTDQLVLKAAVALLVRQQGLEAAPRLFDRASRERDATIRDWMLTVATGLAPQGAAMDRDADRSRLFALLKDRFADPSDRSAAARRLGRLGSHAESSSLLQEVLADAAQGLELRAVVAMALAKISPNEDVGTMAEGIAAGFSGPLTGDALLPVMSTACALARLRRGATAAQIAERFASCLRDHATRAAQIQIDPIDIDTAKIRDIGGHTDQMVRITPGSDPFASSFVMGSDLNNSGARADQGPPTAITMSRSFAFGRFPVTNREYRGFCDATGRPRSQYDENSDWPVVNTTWHDANAYTTWLERITGELYRLPHEVEWEYACRAGTHTRYWWGEDWDATQAPLDANEVVNRFRPNPWGIWCVYGHVYEWCADPWHKNHDGRPASDAVWLANGDPLLRVVRGGSFSWPPEQRRRQLELRSSYRNSEVSTHRQTNYGFRLARTLFSR